MAVDIEKLKEQLLSRIDLDDLQEVEKVHRYISLVELNKQLDEAIKRDGPITVVKNGKQEYIKSHPGINEKMKANTQMLAIEKSFNFISEGTTPSSDKEQYSEDDLI